MLMALHYHNQNWNRATENCHVKTSGDFIGIQQFNVHNKYFFD